MNTQKRKYNVLLAITGVLAVGVLTGCQYCEPLLLAALVIGAVYIVMEFSPFAEMRMTGTKHLNQNH
jgi:hypothetical protein